MSLPVRNVCSGCLTRLISSSSSQSLNRSSIHTKRKLHGSLIPNKHIQQNMLVTSQGFIHNYFSANGSLDRGWVRNGVLATWRTAAEAPRKEDLSNKAMVSTASESSGRDKTNKTLQETIPNPRPLEKSEIEASMRKANTPSIDTSDQILPHRRRRRKSNTSNDNSDGVTSLPLDASSQLTTAATSLPSSANLRRKLAIYLSLTKPRLSFLILLTTTSAYSLYPIPEILSTTASSVDSGMTLSSSTLTFLFLTTGTFLSCACANTLNMLFEPKYDALMTRTRNRPLVRQLLTPRAALLFAIACGASGLLLLDLGTNATVAGLSALNIFLYAGVYTPMKRISAVNTWIGALVGAIPPLMGWCAAAGQAATAEHHSSRDLLFSDSSAGGWLLAALLFAWQFPHFMSLSHTIRDDYRAAGHRMLAWTNPARNARVALRYSLAMFPLCIAIYAAGLVNQGFLAISTVCNLWMTREALRFWKHQGAKGSARGLFWASVWQLPLVLVGALVCKSRIWDGLLSRDEEEEEEEVVSIYDDDEEIDGEDLGMAIKKMGKDPMGHDYNLAMMGFKRPS